MGDGKSGTGYTGPLVKRAVIHPSPLGHGITGQMHMYAKIKVSHASHAYKEMLGNVCIKP